MGIFVHSLADFPLFWFRSDEHVSEILFFSAAWERINIGRPLFSTDPPPPAGLFPIGRKWAYRLVKVGVEHVAHFFRGKTGSRPDRYFLSYFLVNSVEIERNSIMTSCSSLFRWLGFPTPFFVFRFLPRVPSLGCSLTTIKIKHWNGYRWATYVLCWTWLTFLRFFFGPCLNH